MATGISKDGRPKPKTTSAISWMSDKLAAGAARVNGGEFQDVEIAVVKATNHDIVPPKEKHVRTLREIISNSQNRKKVIYIVHALYERLMAPNESWLCVLKTLMVFHKLLKADGEATFKQEMLRYKEKRKLSAILKLNNFSDKSQKESWDYSAFVRVYSTYLEERMHVFESIKFDVDRDGGGTNLRFKTASGQELLKELPRVQKLLHRMLACLPEGAAAEHEVVMEAMRWILTECFRLYRVISEGIINLAQQFFEMDRVDAIKGLEMYRESINSSATMQNFFNTVQNLSIGRQIQFPQLTPPPEDFVQQMEEYVKGATGRTAMRKFPSTVGRNVHGVPSAALAKSDTGSTNPKVVVGLEKTPETQEAHPVEQDLLGLDAIDLSAPTPPQVPPQAPIAPVVPPADPFGDTVFQPLDVKEGGLLDDWGQSGQSPEAVSSVAAAEQNASPFDDFFGGGPMAQPPPAPDSSSPGSHVQPPPPQQFQAPPHPPFQQPPPLPSQAPLQGLGSAPPLGGGFQQTATFANNPFGSFRGLEPMGQNQPFQQMAQPQMPVYQQPTVSPAPFFQQPAPAPVTPPAAAFATAGAFADPFAELIPQTVQKKPSLPSPGVPMRQEPMASNQFGGTAPFQATPQQPNTGGQQEFGSFF